MKKLLLLTAIAGLSLQVFASDPVALDIAKKNNCLACHSIDKKIVGPSWTEIGKKYVGDSQAAVDLASKVKKGSKGVWGPIPMPPNATVKDADINTMVTYILTLGK